MRGASSDVRPYRDCAGINRHEVEDERALRERSSDPLGPEFCTGCGQRTSGLSLPSLRFSFREMSRIFSPSGKVSYETIRRGAATFYVI
jgi:hypothetical protein